MEGLDGLHLALLGLLFTILGGVIVHLVTRSKFVTKTACDAKHQSDCKADALREKGIKASVEDLRADFAEFKEGEKQSKKILFQMVRSIAVRLNLKPDELDKILNASGNGNGGK